MKIMGSDDKHTNTSAARVWNIINHQSYLTGEMNGEVLDLFFSDIAYSFCVYVLYLIAVFTLPTCVIN